MGGSGSLVVLTLALGDVAPLVAITREGIDRSHECRRAYRESRGVDGGDVYGLLLREVPNLAEAAGASVGVLRRAARSLKSC